MHLYTIATISTQLSHNISVVLGNYQILIPISYGSAITNQVTNSDCSQSGFISYG